VKSFSQKGSFAAGPMVMEMTQKMKDNSKFVMEIGQTGMIIMKQVYDGTKGSNVQLGMTAQPMTEDEIKDLQMQIDLLAELNYDKYGIKAELKGIDKVEGKDAYVLEVTKADGSMQSDYYDVSSGLKIQSLVTEDTPMGAMTTTTVVKSYKEFDGIKMPDWIQQMVGPQTVDIKISEVQFNVKLPDSDFKVD
jgi:outer membrane lipoprotein-sorting protein